jgi:hypothetical protein
MSKQEKLIATLFPSGQVKKQPQEVILQEQMDALIAEPGSSLRIDIPRSEQEIQTAERLASHARVSPALVRVFEREVRGPSTQSISPNLPPGNRVVFVPVLGEPKA